jgi:hypothetical protein
MNISLIASTSGSAYGSALGPHSTQIGQAAEENQAAGQDAQPAADDAAAGGKKTSVHVTISAAGRSAASSKADNDGGGDDPVEQAIKQLEQQLQRVMQQIHQVQASAMPDDQKASQLQTLNAEATQLQAQIQSLRDKQIEAAREAAGAAAG